MTTDHKNVTGARKSLRELFYELESWIEVYVSTSDHTSAQVARIYMLRAHARLWSERKRRFYRRMSKLKGIGLSPETVALARNMPMETVLERYFGLALDRYGRGTCPFHGGKNPQSLHKLPSSNRVFCHVCQRSWDPIGAMMTLDRIDFRKAVEILTNF